MKFDKCDRCGVTNEKEPVYIRSVEYLPIAKLHSSTKQWSDKQAVDLCPPCFDHLTFLIAKYLRKLD